MLNNSAEGIVNTIMLRFKRAPVGLLMFAMKNMDVDHAQYVIMGFIKGHKYLAVRNAEQGPITALITTDYPMLNPTDKFGKTPKPVYKKNAIAGYTMLCGWDYEDILNFEVLDYPLNLAFSVEVPDDNTDAADEEVACHVEHYDVAVITPDDILMGGVCVRCAQYWDRYAEDLGNNSDDVPMAERWANEHLYHIAYLHGQVYEDGTLAPGDRYTHGFPTDTYQRLYKAGFTHVAYAPFDPVTKKSAKLRDIVIHPISEVLFRV